MCADTVRVNGILLAADLAAAGLSRERLLSKISERGLFDVPSISTLRRAEKGEPIEIEKLEAIADGVGFPMARYLMTGEELPAETSCKIDGAWEGYYLEIDVHSGTNALGVVSSEMSIIQHGAKLHIQAVEIEAGSGDLERTEETLEATIIRDMVILKSRVAGWAPPFGVGCTLLKVSHGDDYMRGHTIWYGLDSEDISASKCIYVRSASQYRDLYLKKAMAEMEAEIEIRSSKT
jgi:transcriptional regulator with XRE-family HTH domain